MKLELNFVLRLVRSIIRNTTYADITLHADEDGGIESFEIPMGNVELGFLDSVLKILKNRPLNIWLEDGQIKVKDEEKKVED